MGLKSSKGTVERKSIPSTLAPSKSTITASDRVKLELKIQRDNLVAATRKYECASQVEHEKAKEFLRNGNKRKALYCLKREKAQRGQIDTVIGMLDGIQQLLDSVEVAEVSVDVASALRTGKTELERLNKMLNIDDIEKLMCATEESIEEARRIDVVLHQPLLTGQDDDALLRELVAESEVATPLQSIVDVNVPQHNISTEDECASTSVKHEVAQRSHAMA